MIDRRKKTHHYGTIVFNVTIHLLWLFSLHAASYAQAQSEKVIVLNHADSLIGKVIDGEKVQEAIGNVEFIQGNVKVNCDRAIQYRVSNTLELVGNVRVRRDTVLLTAVQGKYYGNSKKAVVERGVKLWNGHVILTSDYGEYYADEKKAYFKQNVTVVDTATVITSDELTYFEKEHKSIATGEVTVVNRQDNATMYGHYLEHYDDRNYSIMTISPTLVQMDTSSTGTIDTLVVVSRTMESFQDSARRFIATDSVQMVQSALSGKSGQALFYSNRDMVIFRKQPILWYSDTQITGDSMHIQLQKRKLFKVHVLGNAFANSRSDSALQNRFDQLTAQSISMYFQNDKIQQIVAEKNSVSLYYLYEKNASNGVDKSSGDKIIIDFIDGKVERFKVIGGVEGQYYPENMVRGKEREYNLAGFRWRNDRPRLQIPKGREIVRSKQEVGSIK